MTRSLVGCGPKNTATDTLESRCARNRQVCDGTLQSFIELMILGSCEIKRDDFVWFVGMVVVIVS